MDFISLLNFRDLGGMKTADGRMVRFKRLLRAAQPVGLSQSDISKLREYNLKKIIDLRTLYEVTRSPGDEIKGVTCTHIDIMGENSAQAASPEYWMELFHKTPTAVETEFTKIYVEFATSESSMAGYSAMLKTCVGLGEGAMLFHCAAGKDRTGFAAAIILKILGASEDDIFKDYLKTKNFHTLPAQVREPYIKRAKAHGFSNEQIEKFENVFNVRKDYLQAAISAAEGKFGSFEKYVKDGLRMKESEIEKLKESYLEVGE